MGPPGGVYERCGYNPTVTIVVLGAGDIGAAVARQVAAADIAARVILVDDAGGVAEGKALDIAQAAPVDRYSTALVGTDDVTTVAGAGMIVMADCVGAGEWDGETGLALLSRVAGLNQLAPIVCAGPQQSTLIDRGVHELGVSRTRLFGSAPEALRGAVLSLVALDAEAAPADISLMVVGRAPHEIIVPWDAASICGRRAIDVLTPPMITRIEDRLPRLWPPSATALGSGAARVMRSMVTRAPRTHALQIAFARGGRTSGRSAMLPARVHPPGILRVEPPPLSSRDRVRLETALAR
jgi:malate/lactate dehydrogenase